VIDDDDGTSDEERAEAAALALAIEGEPARGPADAVETAALLRATGEKVELTSERARAVYAGLEPAIEHYVQPRRSGSLGVLAVLGAGLAMAVAAVLYLAREEPRSAAVQPEAPSARVTLPEPSRELLAAQAAWGAGGDSAAAFETFEPLMRAHRTTVLRALVQLHPALAFVESAHARADAARLPSSDELGATLARPLPAGVRAEHRRVVHQDLLFRIARAELGAGRFEPALAAADRGLALGRAVDLFTANLLVARGEALEKVGQRAAAASAYFEALQINQKLLGAVLSPVDGDRP